jgi:Tfp pilus assembly protein FimT
MTNRKTEHSGTFGFSLVELLIVALITILLTAISMPLMAGHRRLARFNGVAREFVSQLRYARQLAMAERQAITFQYDDTTKQIIIIDHNNDTLSPTSGTAVLANAYPSTASPAAIISTTTLLQGGLGTAEIKYGVPPTADLPSGHAAMPTSLSDGTSLTSLSSNKLNITFQADGSVVNPSGIPVSGVTLSAASRMDSAIFFYDDYSRTGTPTAISILGSSGRVKLWRYVDATNSFTE